MHLLLYVQMSESEAVEEGKETQEKEQVSSTGTVAM